MFARLRTSTRQVAAIFGFALILALVSLVALSGSVSQAHDDASGENRGGQLRALKGGYRNVGNNTATDYSRPLAGAQLEYSSSSSFSGTPTPFPTLTDAAGVTSAKVGSNRWYVRESAAPEGWLKLPLLSWNGATRPYVASANVHAEDRGGGEDDRAGTASVDNGVSTRFVNQLANPALPTSCGTHLRVLMVLDTSQSTKGYGDDYNDAAQSFVTSLAGTPTAMKITSFATTVNSGNAVSYDLSAASGQNSARSRINAIYPNNSSGSGSTNWDAALQNAALANVDVVVMITDGNPTIRVGASTSGGSTSIDDITYAVASANTAKDPDRKPGNEDDQTILGVGVGAGVSKPNLAAISGPTEGTDYVVSSDPEKLAAVLRAIAGKLCPGTITLNKHLVPSADRGRFDLEIDGKAAAVAVGNDGTTGPVSVDGGVHKISESGANGTSLSDYKSTVACVNQDGKAVEVADGRVEVGASDSLDCTFTNTRNDPSIEVVKQLSPTDDPGRFDLEIDGKAFATDVGDDGSTDPVVVDLSLIHI